ncbi:unnamed protein product, partial [Durusdinium trenchii]
MEVGKADFTTEDGREVLIDALINSALCSAPGMMETDPCDLLRRYADGICPKALEQKASYVTVIRDWTGNMINFATTSGIPQQLVDQASNALPRRYDPDDSDVFLLIKGYVSLACSLDDDRKEVLREIAEYLNDNYQQYEDETDTVTKPTGSIADRLTARMEEAMSSTFNFNSVAEMVAMNAQPIIQSIPQSSKEFYLAPWSFDFSEKSKYGENGRFPTNLQYKAHFQSFLRSGYEASREPIDVRFREGGDGTIEPFSVQFVDGQNKMLIIQSILALVELCDDIKEADVDADKDFARVLASFRHVKCNFKKHQRAEQYTYESLSLANRRSEKVKPSCLDYVLIFREAARIKHESNPHMSLRDCVWGSVAEYNKTVPKDWVRG